LALSKAYHLIIEFYEEKELFPCLGVPQVRRRRRRKTKE
jgi:hypothetical protein